MKEKRATEAAMAAAEYLKKPCGRYVVPESDGTFRAEIVEFPGCIAVGDTAAAALASLEDVAESWLESAIARKQRIPEPIENVGYSGKLVVRLPKSLHKKAAQLASREGVSLNQFIVSSVAEQVGCARQTLMQLVPTHQMTLTLYTQVALSGPSNPMTLNTMFNKPLTALPKQEWGHAGG